MDGENEATVGSVGEFACIDRIKTRLPYQSERVKIGIGDDGAVYSVPNGYDQVISTDTVAEGIHFTTDTADAFSVGYRLCAANFSDMAAMGAEPLVFVVAAALPKTLPLRWLEDCYDGIGACAQEYRVSVVGGDVTGSPCGVVLTGTVVGLTPENQAVRRSGARAGDVIFVTGTLGDSAAGLQAILGGERGYPFLRERHLRPKAQVALGKQLRKAGATSLNDVSDGLSRELQEIAAASHVTALVDSRRIPLSEDAKRLAAFYGENPLKWAWNGGEDYELVGTMSLQDFKKADLGKSVTIIGKMADGDGVVYTEENGRRMRMAVGGYDHFTREE